MATFTSSLFPMVILIWSDQNCFLRIYWFFDFCPFPLQIGHISLRNAFNRTFGDQWRSEINTSIDALMVNVSPCTARTTRCLLQETAGFNLKVLTGLSETSAFLLFVRLIFFPELVLQFPWWEQFFQQTFFLFFESEVGISKLYIIVVQLQGLLDDFWLLDRSRTMVCFSAK